MTKFSVIYFILKQRVSNILLLAVMFSSLIIIFMVTLGIKDLFYDYMKSDYGNVPDVKIKLSDIETSKVNEILKDIKSQFKNESLDYLTGYEKLYDVSILDSEELLLSKGLPLFIKGVRFEKNLLVKIDNKIHNLTIDNFSYQDELFISFKLDGLEVKDKENIEFYVKNKPIGYDFCKDIRIENDVLYFYAKPCKTRLDTLLEVLENKKDAKIKVEIDGDVFSTKVIFSDTLYKSLVVESLNAKMGKRLSLGYDKFEIDNSHIENFDIDEKELIINFKQNTNIDKEYKLFLSKILNQFIDYKRLVLKLKLHTFENDDKYDKQDPELVYLNELTDLLDIIFLKDMGNLTVSSAFLAEDLNNFGILDNFTIQTKDSEFNINIRSTIEYNPEKIYDKNILISNIDMLNENLNIKDKNNYIDIYSKSFDDDKSIEKLKSIVKKYDKYSTLVTQKEIIPSIEAKKILFDSSVIMIVFFILGILFIAMYVVMIQFYSNFNSELSLLKLYGSKLPHQTFVNIVALIISIVLIYTFLLQQQIVINAIMMKYFFTAYEINNIDFVLSICVLIFYIAILYFIELKQIKKLNLIKGQ